MNKKEDPVSTVNDTNYSMNEEEGSMPFTPTTTVPKLDATVTVRFSGLMVLKPGAGNTCEVGVHRFSPFHNFQAMLIVHKPTLPLTFIRLTQGQLAGSMSFELRPAQAPDFSGFEPRPFNRLIDGNHEKDHRWILNMQEPHPNVDFSDGARPVVTLKTGILYTGNLTRPGLNPTLEPLIPGGTLQSISLGKGFAADLAVAIDNVPTAEGTGLRIKWEEVGNPEQLILERELMLPRQSDLVNHPGTIYTIALMNDPPTINPLPHDELDQYYKVLRVGGNPIPPNKQYRVKDSAGQTDEVPCMPIGV